MPLGRVVRQDELGQGDMLGEILEDDADALVDRHIGLGLGAEVGRHEAGDDLAHQGQPCVGG